MERLEMVEKLRKKTNISYEEAKDALEKSQWDILDAMLYLEENKKIKAPLIRIYTTDSEEAYHGMDSIEVPLRKDEKAEEGKKSDIFENFFEWICKIIDKGNNIFLQVKRSERVLVKLPITVLILCLFFTFWFVIPLFIIGLFIDIKYEVIGNDINKEKINSFFSYLSKSVNNLKEKNKKGYKND